MTFVFCSSRDFRVHQNFFQLSAIFGVVTGLQHAVVKQIIRIVFCVVTPVFSVFLKNGTKKEEADEAMVLVSFCLDDKTTNVEMREANVSSTEGGPQLASPYCCLIVS